MKTASFFYALALLSLPIGSATKLLLGREDMVWIDPTLMFSAFAFAALVFSWSEIETAWLSGIIKTVALLITLCLASAGMGLLLRPAPELYNVLREPERVALTMIWLVTSCWFLRFKPAFVAKFAAMAALIGLASGLYVYMAALGLIPSPDSAVMYSRRYLILQAVWYQGMLVPRMGGLFVEAPPFGLFMFALGTVFWVVLRAGIRSRLILGASVVSILGVIASFAGQVLLGASICLSAMVLSHKVRQGWIKPAAIAVIAAVLVVGGWQSLVAKGIAANSTRTTNIDGDSVGERDFHLNYGFSLLGNQPLAVFLGIGPGRYGEYAAETGYFADTTTMQFTPLELLVEWGIVGLSAWTILAIATSLRVYRNYAYTGVFILGGLLIANSFQASWKSEAFFLAVAALCTRFNHSELTVRSNTDRCTITPPLESAGAMTHL